MNSDDNLLKSLEDESDGLDVQMIRRSVKWRPRPKPGVVASVGTLSQSAFLELQAAQRTVSSKIKQAKAALADPVIGSGKLTHPAP
jgi:hypothetical protein